MCAAVQRMGGTDGLVAAVQQQTAVQQIADSGRQRQAKSALARLRRCGLQRPSKWRQCQPLIAASATARPWHAPKVGLGHRALDGLV